MELQQHLSQTYASVSSYCVEHHRRDMSIRYWALTYRAGLTVQNFKSSKLPCHGEPYSPGRDPFNVQRTTVRVPRLALFLNNYPVHKEAVVSVIVLSRLTGICDWCRGYMLAWRICALGIILVTSDRQ